MFLCWVVIKLPLALCSITFRHTGKFGCIDPTGCQKLSHGFLLAAESGSNKIGGSKFRSGTAEVNGENTKNDKVRLNKKKFCCCYQLHGQKPNFPRKSGMPTIQCPLVSKQKKKKC